MQKLLTVLFLRHFQAELKIEITPHLFIDNPCRPLRRQDQMQPQAAADPANLNQILHKFWLRLLQFGEFVDDQHAMRQRRQLGMIKTELAVVIQIGNRLF